MYSRSKFYNDDLYYPIYFYMSINKVHYECPTKLYENILNKLSSHDYSCVDNVYLCKNCKFSCFIHENTKPIPVYIPTKIRNYIDKWIYILYVKNNFFNDFFELSCNEIMIKNIME